MNQISKLLTQLWPANIKAWRLRRKILHHMVFQYLRMFSGLSQNNVSYYLSLFSVLFPLLLDFFQASIHYNQNHFFRIPLASIVNISLVGAIVLFIDLMQNVLPYVKKKNVWVRRESKDMNSFQWSWKDQFQAARIFVLIWSEQKKKKLRKVISPRAYRRVDTGIYQRPLWFLIIVLVMRFLRIQPLFLLQKRHRCNDTIAW